MLTDIGDRIETLVMRDVAVQTNPLILREDNFKELTTYPLRSQILKEFLYLDLWRYMSMMFKESRRLN